ncbi:MAG: restriction endonuclease subunit S [Gammaproteobacteria bacterium]|nr:restriction endonuclease subunit S [Gammaproteobacteria bacterium]MBU2059027.1 restriction endonuclease subunit S [Gammaproteobacteria bacterium]MBU2174790.1 restriction endonuclease subunit S [Gammaproteobacteria bacterium]MBU2245763.1 restriction endonuclease subunit S [Gammaproteobacteria bacterium]MBU2343245.1 restriction endonuclease subunit S [Gammaproteobacteria bacterium]
MSAVENLIIDNLDLWSSAIKSKSSAGRGSNKKIELYGIKKLRELILELAVRGLLVPQDPSDEPAKDLLKKIATEKIKRIKAGELKRQKPLPAIGDEEKPFALPKGWEWTCLYQISEIAPRNNLHDNLEVSFVPMPMVSTSYKGEHDHEVKIWADIKKGYTHFADGDIGLAKITPCFENSKAAVFKGLKNGFGAGTTELHIARPIANTIEPLFILLYLKSPMFLEKGKTKMTGSAGQKRVPTDYFSYNPLPLAPLAEQRRIVSKVDELMQLCDQLEQHTETTINTRQVLVEQLLAAIKKPEATISTTALELLFANFDSLFTTEHSIEQLKQSILQLAVMGKLAPQDPNDEPASELIKKITTEKNKLIKTGLLKKQKPLPPISDEEKPFALPKTWEWIRFGECVSLKSGSNFSSEQELEFGEIPYCKVSDMNMIDNIHTLTTSSRFINPSDKELAHLIPAGSIAFPKRGGAIATNKKRFITKQIFVDLNVMTATPYQPMVLSYVMKWLEHIDLASLNSGTSVPQINNKDIEPLCFPCPPLEEQQRIVAKVDILMRLCDQLKADLTRSQSTKLLLADVLAEQTLAV